MRGALRYGLRRSIEVPRRGSSPPARPHGVLRRGRRRALRGPGDRQTFSSIATKATAVNCPTVVPAPLYQGRQLDFTGGAPAVSSDGKWVVVQGGIERAWGAVVVYPVSGGSPTLVCGACTEPPNFERGFQTLYVDWTPDGKFLYLNFRGPSMRFLYGPVRPCRPFRCPDFERSKRWLLYQERD